MKEPLFTPILFAQAGDYSGYFWRTIFLLALFFVVITAFSYLIYFLLTLPMRRKERARFFLDLIEIGIKNGKSLEETIVSIAKAHDRSVSVRFHLLAAHIESGFSLLDALYKVPALLPPQIVAMLKVGMETGNISAILPACRKVVEEGVLQVRKAENYLIVLLVVTSPLTLMLMFVLSVWVFPSVVSRK